MNEERQTSFSEEELQEYYSLDGIYDEVIKYSDISLKLDRIIYSKEFLEKEKKYLKNNIM